MKKSKQLCFLEQDLERYLFRLKVDEVKYVKCYENRFRVEIIYNLDLAGSLHHSVVRFG